MYLLISVIGGILFGVLDGLIHGNPYARKLYAAYKPIAKESINVPAGLAIDLIYGFVLAGLFLLLFKSLPGQSGFVKGLSYAVIVWFLRVAMSAVSSWMMFNIPLRAIAYSLVSGLLEMLILGILFGLTLKP